MRIIRKIKFHPVLRHVNAFEIHQSGTKTMRSFKKRENSVDMAKEMARAFRKWMR